MGENPIRLDDQQMINLGDKNQDKNQNDQLILTNVYAQENFGKAPITTGYNVIG